MIVGSSPSGTLATSNPIAKTEASVKVRPGQHAERQEGDAHRHGHPGDQPGHPTHLQLERAGVLVGAARESRDASELGRHAGVHHQGQRLPGGAGGAGQHDVVGVDDADRRSPACRGDHRPVCLHGRRLAGHRRHVQLDGPVEEAGVRADRRPFLQDHQIARDHPAASTTCTVAVPDDGGMRRQVARQRRDRVLGVPLLHQGEAGVDARSRR